MMFSKETFLCVFGQSAHGITNVVWSPDEKWIACELNNGKIVILRADSGEDFVVCDGQYGFLSKVSWSSHAEYLLAGYEDGAIVIWEALSGKSVEQFSHGKGQGHVIDCRWSPDASLIASTGFGEAFPRLQIR